MSPIIYEVLAVATGITNGRGELVGLGACIPSFIGVLDTSAVLTRSREGQCRDTTWQLL